MKNHGPITTIAAAVVLMLLSVVFAAAQADARGEEDPGHKEYSRVPGVKFSVPNGCELQKTTDPRIAYMANTRWAFDLFVAVSKGAVTDKYLTSLSCRDRL